MEFTCREPSTIESGAPTLGPVQQAHAGAGEPPERLGGLPQTVACCAPAADGRTTALTGFHCKRRLMPRAPSTALAEARPRVG